MFIHFFRAQLVHEQLFYESANKIDQKNIRKSFYSKNILQFE